jgi:formylglycine-generating enzyme
MIEQRYALLIGNNEFPKAAELSPLRCPPQDVEDLAKVLADPKRGQFQVTPLINKTKAEIERQLDSILSNASKNDLVLIYFSGHGKPSNLKGSLYLVTQDTELKLLKSTALAVSHLKELIEESRCNRIILLLDCCHSGAIGKAMLKGELSTQVEQTLNELANDEGSGIHIMTASTAIQTAEEKQADDYSVFTKHIIQGIATGAADQYSKGVISFNDLFAYVKQQLKAESTQTPQAFNLGGSDLLIAYSGKSSRKERLRNIESLLDELLSKKQINGRLHTAAITLLESPAEKLTEAEQQRDNLLSELSAGEIDVVEFIGKWAVAGLMQKTVERTPLIINPPTPKIILHSAQQWTGERTGVDAYGIYADIEFKGVTQRFRWLAAGSFLMGSPTTEVDRSDDEVQHSVTLTQGFWLADTTVTQALWSAVMGNNPSRFQDNQNNPVEQVSWNDAQTFIVKLNQLNPELHAQLPTEAQWEYACRAGTDTPFSFGKNITPEQVNYNGNRPYADGKQGLYREKIVAVRSLPPNAWGLYEMHGNVWEWCSDIYGGYPSEAVTNPVGTATGTNRVLRGGSWFILARHTRSAGRSFNAPGLQNFNAGFRVALGQRLK